MFSLKPIITTLNLSWMLSHCKNKDCWFGQMATSWPLNKPIHNDPRSLVTNRLPTLCVGAHHNFFQACFLFFPNDCLVWWCVMNLKLSFIFLSPNCQHVGFNMHCAHCARFYYVIHDSIISASLSYWDLAPLQLLHSTIQLVQRSICLTCKFFFIPIMFCHGASKKQFIHNFDISLKLKGLWKFCYLWN
jgi:hypothetical protein